MIVNKQSILKSPVPSLSYAMDASLPTNRARFTLIYFGLYTLYAVTLAGYICTWAHAKPDSVYMRVLLDFIYIGFEHSKHS